LSISRKVFGLFLLLALGMRAGDLSGAVAASDIRSIFFFDAPLLDLVPVMPQIPDSRP